MADTAKPKVMHVMNSFSQGGLEIAILTLIKRGFYEGTDLSVVGLVRGNGPAIYDEFIDRLGPDRVTTFANRVEPPTKAETVKFAWNLNRKLHEIKPDAAILSGSYSTIVGRVAAFTQPATKIITFEHNAERFSRMTSAALFLTANRNDVVYGDTAQTLAVTGIYHSSRNPTYEIPLVVVDKHTPRQSENPQHFNILSVGRLSTQKNYLELVRAAKIIADKGYKFTLTLAGEGGERGALEAEAKNLGIADRIKMPGWVDRTTFDKAAHIYIQPSKFEGLCLATVEAMAAGVPTLATNFGGARDYGVDGKNMLKIKGYTAADIAQSLCQMMDNYPTLAPTLSQAGITTMQERFGEPAVKQKWQLAARELVTPRGTSENTVGLKWQLVDRDSATQIPTSISSSQPAQRPSAEFPSHPYPQLRK